jgi:ATP-dependent exoDNAse (exonuclease V) alpha subunit
MKKNNQYPLKHLSVRVPWHDNGWNGTVCKSPSGNNACLALKNCALNRKDKLEDAIAGQSIEDLDQAKHPTCVGERATFMAPFSFTKVLEHPYVDAYPSTHGHLRDTPLRYPAYSANSVPYRWMSKTNNTDFIKLYSLDYDDQREPQLVTTWGEKKNSNWVQHSANQHALLNCFYEHLENNTSLVFFYAEQVPFVENSGKILVGVGRIKDITPSKPFNGSNAKFSASYWEHMVEHSIRPDYSDGFLLPYHAALDYQLENPTFDPAQLAVSTPDDRSIEFAYASEHVATDTAIRVLYECTKSIELAKEFGIGDRHDKILKWIHNEVAGLEKLRGNYPGMGAALCALGIEKGHFVAAEISSTIDADADQWQTFEDVLAGKSVISDKTNSLIPSSVRQVYTSLKSSKDKTRIDLLHLISRFDISIEQAKYIFVPEERDDIDVKDSDFIDNPYLIYEVTRKTKLPVSLYTVDIGIFKVSKSGTLLPESLKFNDPLDNRRIRAFTIYQLEAATVVGHTLLPRKQIIRNIRKMSVSPSCEVNSDYFASAEQRFPGEVELDVTQEGEVAYQLTRLNRCSSVIRDIVQKRKKGVRHNIAENWRALLDQKIEEEQIRRYSKKLPVDETEENARKEKASALNELSNSRISVLIGPAGTGKTTLLSILAKYPSISTGGVLLLAPTGKARVRMEEMIKGSHIRTATIAQFLRKPYKRYLPALQQYVFSNIYCEAAYETVIIDECSMLTEEMIATTLDCFKGVKRFILVGDHRQLPPIGAGRPFFDIINYLKPEDVNMMFPRIAPSYAELTIKRRQEQTSTEDILLAEWFSGDIPHVADDDIFQKIATNPNTKFLRIEKWEKEGDFDKLMHTVIENELGIKSVSDFNNSIGAQDGVYFNSTGRANYLGANPTVEKVEDWQILSPVREKLFGVQSINRSIHVKYRQQSVHEALFGKKVPYPGGEERTFKVIPKPLGSEQIVYGDKVINLGNHERDAYPDGSLNYLANGEIGIVVGQFKSKADFKKYKGQPQWVKIEFCSQKGYEYSFVQRDFKEESNQPLELAYALTVHKAQGSEFKKVFFILPNPCFLLNREMLYTALTRQREKVIILYQGNLFDIKNLSSPLYSDTLSRITNLFLKPNMIEIEGRLLERNLIHTASDGKLLRSKSELAIYQRLIDKGLSPLYEKSLIIKGVEKLPDFTIEDDDSGVLYYWEHCGMLYDKSYEERWQAKYKWYHENDIKPWSEGGGANGTLIVTKDDARRLEDGTIRGALSIPDIDKIILDVFGKA